jgi:protein O-mannosyl-transferase
MSEMEDRDSLAAGNMPEGTMTAKSETDVRLDDGTRRVPGTMNGTRSVLAVTHGTQSALATSVGAAIIAACVLLAYYPCLRGGFIMDDDLLVTENVLVKVADGPIRFWFTTQAMEYYPVTNTLYWIEWRIWGTNPIGYRVVNLAIHVIDALLIWFILRKLSIPGAFVAALIFAVHPVNVDSVAWIAQLRNVLALCFFLLSILAYLRSETEPPARDNRKIVRGVDYWYGLSLAAFVLAMLSKGSAAMLPVMLLGVIWWRRGHVIVWDVVGLTPFFVAAAGFTWVNIWFQTHGSGDVIRNVGLLERVLGAGGVVWFYLYKAILPLHLCFVYPQWRISVANPLWWIPLLAAMAVTVVLWRHRKGWSRPFLFAWGFFCVALVPVMGFADTGFMQYSLVADHYEHIAVIGVIALAAAGIGAWHRSSRSSARGTAVAVAVAAAGILFFVTWRHSALYGEAITLYEATLIDNPDSALVHNNLGTAFTYAGRLRDAMEHFQRALAIKSDYAVARNNLGAHLIEVGRLREATEHLEKAVQLDPKFPEAHSNLGRALLYSGDVNGAISCFERALKIKPYYPDPYCYLGIALTKIGKVQGAALDFEQALRFKPDFVLAHDKLAIALMAMDREPEAIKHFKTALQLAPDDVHIHTDMGIAMASMGKHQEAIKYFQRAIDLDPSFPEPYFRLGLLLADMGRKREAIEHFEQALRFDADHPVILYNLGLALDETGQVREAIDYFGQAIRVKPDYLDAYTSLMAAYARTGNMTEAIATGQKAVEVARSKREREQVKKIEELLESYEAEPGK